MLLESSSFRERQPVLPDSISASVLHLDRSVGPETVTDSKTEHLNSQTVQTQ